MLQMSDIRGLYAGWLAPITHWLLTCMVVCGYAIHFLNDYNAVTTGFD